MSTNPPVHAEEFVKQLCSARANIRYNRIITLDGKPANIRLLEGRLILDARILQHKFTDATIKYALEQYLQENDARIVERYASAVSFSPLQTDEPLRAWVKAVTGVENELDVTVMKHFIWQVKRKMHGLPVEYELMPVICGQTGSGKSRAVERLIEPLRELAEVGRDFDIFTDVREHFIFHRAYIVALDEMAKADSTDVNAIKQVISAKDISYRVLYTQGSAVGRMVSTFIGTSNNFLNEVILDPTSARRFWQLESAPKADWMTINSIDYSALWRCVDESVEQSPIRPVWKDVQDKQHTEFRYKTAVEDWFEGGWEVEKPDDKGKWVGTRASAAFEAFHAWALAANQGQKISSRRFGSELLRIAGVERTKRANGAYYSVRPRAVEQQPASEPSNKTYGNVVDFLASKGKKPPQA